MKTLSFTRIVRETVVVALALVALASNAAYADLIKNGEDKIPGGGGKSVKWRAGYKKSPGVGKSVHFWFDMTLKDPAPTDNVTFVVCAMINVNKPKIDMPAYKATLGGGKWTCVANGTENWYPNYHFGCKRITLNAANNWHDNSSFDKTVDLSVDFAEADLVSPYLDFAVDCPGGFVNCDPVFDKADRFLEPGVGVGPDATASWWVVTEGGVPNGPIVNGSEGWNTGNWYTMGYRSNLYPAVLDGYVTGLPQGALVSFSFPPSTGGGVQTYEVGGVGCAGESLHVSIPFTIDSTLMFENDESTHMQFYFGGQFCSQDPRGRLIEFKGQVLATNYSYFPDNRVLYAPGDFMYGVHAQYAVEDDAPFVVSHIFEVGPGGGCIFMQAADPSTMVIAATLHRTLGNQVFDTPIPYDVPSAVGSITHFRSLPFTFDPASSYSILLVDDANNTNVLTLGVGPEATVASGPTLALSGANPSAGPFFLDFTLAAQSFARVDVIDISGRRVRSLHARLTGPGRHVVAWDGLDDAGRTQPAGLYLARLSAGGRTKEVKLVRTR